MTGEDMVGVNPAQQLTEMIRQMLEDVQEEFANRKEEQAAQVTKGIEDSLKMLVEQTEMLAVNGGESRARMEGMLDLLTAEMKAANESAASRKQHGKAGKADIAARASAVGP